MHVQRYAQRNARRGQALVEFTLVALLFLLITLGLMQLALLFHVKLMISHASREGVRYAATRGADNGLTDPAILQQIKDFVKGRTGTLNPPLRDGDIVITPVKAQDDDSARVAICYNARPCVPLIAPLLPKSLEITASSEMRVER